MYNTVNIEEGKANIPERVISIDYVWQDETKGRNSNGWSFEEKVVNSILYIYYPYTIPIVYKERYGYYTTK